MPPPAHRHPRPTGSTGAQGHAVVIGGGIAGLAAAHRLLAEGVRVTLLEAGPRLGGKLYSGELAGLPVDLGAESMLARRPEAVALAEAVGLAAAVQAPATATAHLWTRGALRPMPRGHVMGVPGDLGPLAASGVLSAEGLARIEAERTLPPTEIGEDVAVGEYVAARLGREVVDRLVEPLLGGVYAGDAYRISMRAAVPQLFEAARTHALLGDGVRALQRRAEAAPQPPVRSSPASTAASDGSRSPSPRPAAPRGPGSSPTPPSARSSVRPRAGGWWPAPRSSTPTP